MAGEKISRRGAEGAEEFFLLSRTEATETRRLFDDSRKYHTEAQRAQRGPRCARAGLLLDGKAHAEAQRAQRNYLLSRTEGTETRRIFLMAGMEKYHTEAQRTQRGRVLQNRCF